MAFVCPIDAKYPNEISALLSPPSPLQVQVISLNFIVAVSFLYCASFGRRETRVLETKTYNIKKSFCSSTMTEFMSSGIF